MSNNYPTLTMTTKNLRIFLCFAAFMALSITTYSQTCPDPGGGVRSRGLDFIGGATADLYPRNVPADQSGLNRSTVGFMRNTSSVTSTFGTNEVRIHPILDNGPTGRVALYFRTLEFGDAPDATLRVYQGAGTGGTLLLDINAANASSYATESFDYPGTVTVVFASPTAGTTGSFSIDVRYMTGDQVFDSSFGRKVAVWTDFVQPNSYTFVDDQRSTIPNPPFSLNTNPICIAHFDNDRQFVSADRAFCVDSPYRNVGFGWLHYPGHITFTRYTRYDIDRNTTEDGTDQLKTARLIWLMADRANEPIGNLRGVNDDVWTIVSSGNGGGAQNAVTALPTPVEPTFSITSTGSPAVINNNVTFTVNFDIAGAHPARLRLVVPSGVTIESVSGTGVDYTGGFLNFASLPAVATIEARSTTPQTASIQVVYDEDGFWNVTNMYVYKVCDDGNTNPFQDFLGRSQGETPRPYRESDGSWTDPLPVSLIAFNASEEKGTVSLNWATAMEKNNQGFEIQRSQNAHNWSKIGFVAGQSSDGNSNRELPYRFVDAQPLPGLNYYRLKQLDFDGTYEHSPVRSVAFASGMALYPNPTADGRFRLPANLKAHAVEVFDLTGRKVMTHGTVESNGYLDLSSLPSGLYLVKSMLEDGSVSTGKITFLK